MAAQTLHEYAIEQVAARLGRLAFEVRRTRKSPEPEAVHDLRVSIRRFNQSLRVFRTLLPQRPARKIRRRLRGILKLAGQLRNQDIALDLLTRFGLSGRSTLSAGLKSKRKNLTRQLTDLLQRYDRRGFSSKWRVNLELNSR